MILSHSHSTPDILIPHKHTHIPRQSKVGPIATLSVELVKFVQIRLEKFRHNEEMLFVIEEI